MPTEPSPSKAEPVKWLAWTLIFAVGTTLSISNEHWVLATFALFFAAASGGELAIQNAKWRMIHHRDSHE